MDALFTAASATCVTGLVTVYIAGTYSIFGQAVIALLIQTGGLGVACVGVWLILLMGGRVSLKSRILVKEAWNASSLKGMIPLVRRGLAITLFFEGLGAVLGYFVFLQDYLWPKALKISIFHAVSAFNNAGLDLLGNMQGLMPYRVHGRRHENYDCFCFISNGPGAGQRQSTLRPSQDYRAGNHFTGLYDSAGLPYNGLRRNFGTEHFLNRKCLL